MSEILEQTKQIRGSAISTSQLTKVFPAPMGPLTAVDHLDLEVAEGEIFGLLGPNGAGKTTTVGMLCTRVIPTSGSAIVGGIDVVADPTVAKQVISVVSQSNTLDRSLSVEENLFFHGRYFGMAKPDAKSEAQRMLEQFRLTDRARADVNSLSGGMAQRLLIARAIMHRPQILFLDEPTAGLDPQSRLALWEILRQIHAAGQTIMLTTHYMEEADALCERVAIMDHGRILALGSPEELKRSVGADTEIKISAAGDLQVLADELLGFDGATGARVIDGHVRLNLKGAEGAVPKIVNFCDSKGFALQDLSVTEPTLETVFINLTGKDLRE
ncbi:MAG: ATP-binding cassette domain-containing protein [Actinomycetota bacterium]